MTEIARILAKDPQIVLLDEPTSALSDAERETLFGIIRRLQARGVGIIYISHRLQEVPLIGTRVTVLRDGQVIGTLPVEQADTDTLINMMVGRRLTEQFPKSNVPTQEVVLRGGEVCHRRNVLHDLSFELRRGEILGIFGLMGAGQTELAESLVWPEVSARRVSIFIDGRDGAPPPPGGSHRAWPGLSQSATGGPA